MSARWAAGCSGGITSTTAGADAGKGGGADCWANVLGGSTPRKTRATSAPASTRRRSFITHLLRAMIAKRYIIDPLHISRGGIVADETRSLLDQRSVPATRHPRRR